MRALIARSLVALALLAFALPSSARLQSGDVQVWQMQEITFAVAREYANPYVDVECWVDLQGPDFKRRVYGFWDGGRTFKVRVVATRPGEWSWKAGSNPDDPGLRGAGKFRAIAWSAADLAENPNRRGFVRATGNGHALQYADGTPFFLTGDTWLAASTWRLPFKGVRAATDYEPAEGISFEEAVAWRKRQGFNSVSFIAAFPNWAADEHGATFANKDGVYLRNAWEKFGSWAPDAKISTADGATTTAKDMHDEQGNRPFEIFADREGLANFDALNPKYFASLDRKMRHLSEQGFVPFLETIRRDNAPSWKRYFDFNASYSRFVQYLIARYGAYNLVFSGIHLDWIPKDFSLTADEFNAALTYHHAKYGPLPFGQPFTTLIDRSTFKAFGHGANAPWLTMHTVGNNPRNHAIYQSIEELFRLTPAYPAANLEPYYTGWNHAINRPGGETPEENSERDNYFARAMMYGSVLSGALGGHVHGTAAYDMTSTGEPSGWRPYFWTALQYKSGAQMRQLRDFVLSEGDRYQQLELAAQDLQPRINAAVPADGLDGWSFLMRTPARDFALAYFENQALRARLAGFRPGARYDWRWFDPRSGQWSHAIALTADAAGVLVAPRFVPGGNQAAHDMAAKILTSR
ncbi:MAG: DUF5060 domain-containing protein [Pseudomonadota bacterium]